jgi:hypothetical protein
MKWLLLALAVLVALWGLMILSTPLQDGYSLPEGKVHHHNHQEFATNPPTQGH